MSNFFVEKIFDNVMSNAEKNKIKIENKMELVLEKLRSALDIRTIEIPIYE